MNRYTTSKPGWMITTTVITTLLAAPALASRDKDDDRMRYREHIQQRQQMHMEMMQMMTETMTILRDLNHMPSAAEKKRLGDMIRQMNEMMAKQKDMDEKVMKYMDDEMGRPMMGGPRQDMR